MGYYRDSWNDADQQVVSVDEHYEELEKAEESIRALETQIEIIKDFLKSLLHPEEYGWAVTQEVRNLAKAHLEDLEAKDGA